MTATVLMVLNHMCHVSAKGLFGAKRTVSDKTITF